MVAGPLRRWVRRREVQTLAVVVLITAYYAVRFHDCVLGFFTLDDLWIMDDAARIQLRGVLDLGQFLRPNHNGFLLYRPLTQVGYFYTLHQLFDYDSSPYHAIQLGVHIANALLVFGIARRLTQSTLASLAAALIYAAAPGHVVAVYWLAAFTMTGTALIVLLMIYVWLSTNIPWRAVGCSVLQGLGLLASEHAVVAPALLGIVAVLGMRREPARRVMRDVAVPLVLVGSYLTGKAYYFTAVRRFAPGEAYALHFDAVGWLLRVGRYAAASLGAVPFSSAGELVLTAGGATVVVITLLASWRALRGDDRWRLLALGSAVFLVALLPVLPLRGHYYDYFIGIAAAGVALATVGACQLVTRWWRGLAAALAGAMVLVHAAASDPRAHPNADLALLTATAEWSARWIDHVARVGASSSGASTVLVPREPLTEYVFVRAGALRFFAARPPRVILYDRALPPRAASGTVILQDAPDPIAPGQPLPGWRQRWNWLRRWDGWE